MNVKKNCWRRPGALLPFVALAIGGCTGVQSALDPKGPAAATIAGISWIMFAGAALIFLSVIILLACGLLHRPACRRAIDSNLFIIGGGVILPVVTLSALLVYAMFAQASLVETPGEEPLVVEVIGHQWWWEMTYRDGDVSQRVTTANELHIPAGRPVELHLESRDVIHTFWVPNLAGKRDMVPGHTNVLHIEADKPGLFRGQCNEFCGDQHALMSLFVVSETPKDFERWLAGQRKRASVPTDPFLKKGHDAFMTAGCALCHTVRGTQARGQVAPDLTHFGSRHSIAAATLRNNTANLEAWIVSAQHLKPDNRMPNYHFDGETLHAVAAWLESLE